MDLAGDCKLYERIIDGMEVWFREGVGELSSDEEAIEEVLVRKCYRNLSLDFDVLPGERWLDLGANIGAFALYCRSRGAAAVCYEPDPGCFEILRKNAANFTLVNAAVTSIEDSKLRFRKSNNPTNHWRGTVVTEGVPERYIEASPVNNIYAGSLVGETFDGIKMDVEGSEGPILDHWLLPHCSKLVLEYHHTRDQNPANLLRRLCILQRHFELVAIPKVYSDLVAGLQCKLSCCDQLIFCLGPRTRTASSTV